MAGVAQDGNNDASDVEFVASPFRMFLMVLLGLSITGVCAVVAFRLIPGYTPRRLFVSEIAIVAFIFFGALTLGWIWNALTLRGVVVSVGPSGVLDRRISEKLIPWSAIEDVEIRQENWQKFVLVRLRSEFKASFPVRIDALLFSLANRPFGWNGYVINPRGVAGRKADLLAAVTDYWERSKTVPVGRA